MLHTLDRIVLLVLFVAGLNSWVLLSTAQPQQTSAIQQIAVGLVAPIHVALVPNSGKVIFLERINGGAAGTTHTQEFDPISGQSRALQMTSDAFCSSGFISPDAQGKFAFLPL